MKQIKQFREISIRIRVNPIEDIIVLYDRRYGGASSLRLTLQL